MTVCVVVLPRPVPRPTVGTGSESGKTNRRSGYRIGVRQDEREWFVGAAPVPTGRPDPNAPTRGYLEDVSRLSACQSYLDTL